MEPNDSHVYDLAVSGDALKFYVSSLQVHKNRLSEAGATLRDDAFAKDFLDPEELEVLCDSSELRETIRLE